VNNSNPALSKYWAGCISFRVPRPERVGPPTPIYIWSSRISSFPPKAYSRCSQPVRPGLEVWNEVQAGRDTGWCAPWEEGEPPQDATRSISKSNEVTITMPVHPLRGETLALVRVERDRNSGCRYVLAETPEGRRLRIPESWTDRCVFVGPHQIDGREAKLVLSGLLCLADAVADMGKCRNIDIRSEKAKIRGDTEQKARHGKNSKGCSMAGAVVQDTGRAARGTCRPGAQDASYRDGGGRRRGRK